MNKMESLAFLQSCIEKIQSASDEEMKKFDQIYKMNCTGNEEQSDFQFVIPTSECKYDKNNIFELETSNDSILLCEQKDFEYKFVGNEFLNQQNDENLAYAA